MPGTKSNPVMHGNDKLFPWHGANSGDLDLLGNIKPAAHWRNISGTWAISWPWRCAAGGDKKIIVVGWGWYPTLESWTWPGWEGKPMAVEVYSKYDQVRLYLNGKSLGDQPVHDCKTTYKVPYEAGTLKAVGLQNGKEVDEVTFETAGAPAGIRLTADREKLEAGGQDLSFVKVEVVDDEGHFNRTRIRRYDSALPDQERSPGWGTQILKERSLIKATTVMCSTAAPSWSSARPAEPGRSH